MPQKNLPDRRSTGVLSRAARERVIPRQSRSPLGFARNHARRFAYDESGNLIIFGVYIWVLMFMVAGIGIDLMRVERDRTSLQYTLDRAVLAAADLDQTQDPTLVVNDYFNKSNLSSYLTSVTVKQGLGYRIVSADATMAVDTQFMHMNGVDTLSAPAAGTAEESLGGVEVSLVLDVSGSMNSYSRLTNLKVAAKDFVDQMNANSEDGKLSISIIPYATQVSVPDSIFSQLNTTKENDHANCINFDSSDFSSSDISLVSRYESTMYFDPWNYYNGRSYNPDRLVTSPICEDSPAREILPLQKDPATLKTYIDAMTAGGNTSIDLGMKWGTALLDPAFQPVTSTLAAGGSVPSVFTQRPNAFNDGETLKVIVLMTDGQNTSQYYVEDDYRSGNSNVWWNDSAGKYSIYVPQYASYWWPHNSSWQDHPYGSGSAVNLSYKQLWESTSLAWNAYYNYAGWMGSSSAYNAWYYPVFSYVTSSIKNTRTSAICDAAKAQGIIVYTIGFEAPASGDAVLKACASSPAHFFDVSGLQIAEAFSSIASSIRKLRLTQ